MKNKKIICVILTCVMFLMSAMPVFGDMQGKQEWYEMNEEEFTVSDQASDSEALIPRSMYIVNVLTQLQKLGSQKLGLHVDVYCSSSVNRIQTTFYLQKLVNGSWQNVSSGSVSASSSSHMSKGMSVSGVSAGTYRAKTNTLVSHNGYSETATGFSGSMTIK